MPPLSKWFGANSKKYDVHPNNYVKVAQSNSIISDQQEIQGKMFQGWVREIQKQSWLCKKFQMLRKIWVFEHKNALLNTFLPLFVDFVCFCKIFNFNFGRAK